MKSKVVRLLLMTVMGIVFVYCLFFVLKSDQVNKSFSFLTLVSVAGVASTITSIYKSKFITIIFLSIPIYSVMIFSFIYSVLSNISLFRYAFILLIFIYLVRIIRLGWITGNE